MLLALLLTLAVETPLYAVALHALRLAGLRRAALLGVLVNLVTHPVLWTALSSAPSPAAVWVAEAVVCAVEAAILLSLVRRDALLLLVVGIGANAASVLAGVLVL